MRLFIALLLAACTSPAPTKHISAELVADLDEDHGTLSVSLGLHDYYANPQGIPPTYILDDDEHLRATFLGQHFELKQNPYSIDDDYVASVPVADPVAMGEPLVVTFDRGGGDSIELTATAPEDFTVQQPPPSPAPVTVTWSPASSDLMLWSAGNANGAVQNDIGSLEFPAEVLPSPGGEVDFSRLHGDAPFTKFLFTILDFRRTHAVTVEVTP
jgi:hypothetical protein